MEKASQNDSPSTSSPFYGLVDLFDYSSVFNKVQSFFFSIFSLFLLCHNYSSGNSKIREEKHFSESGLSQRESFPNERSREDDGKLGKEEVKMVMEKLGFSCSPESEELGERYGSNEISGLFDEQEPSLEEVKEAFDVFDVNRDGVIDAVELQRVLCLLGVKEAMELKNCQKMISKFDENGDGRIDFSEFVEIMENSFC
ncbi:hypothetical protein L6164_007495 [Bauhinia variegata]|uniref:Uncharacterized protein n=1 Tax=Bauhinia variegata TaxID=167791 RepID=A0ACB9PF72_BAUVA|nr:hypothetical protein L6164_007495 [Bauhinia variegata]